MEKSFGILVGDERQRRLAALLRRDGAATAVYDVGQSEDALEQVLRSDVVILPLPMCRQDGGLNCAAGELSLEQLFSRLQSRQRILAGMVGARERAQAAQYDLTLEDYFQSEELTIINAAATAEGAIYTAMEHSDRMLLGQKALVLGFGRIGKLLSLRLQGLGVWVTAAARRPETLAWIRAYGYQALELTDLDKKLGDYSLVFNTIPAPILGRELLAQLPSHCICIDLASCRGIDGAEELGLTDVWARSLPGRLMPETAAETMQQTIYRILSKERGAV